MVVGELIGMKYSVVMLAMMLAAMMQQGCVAMALLGGGAAATVSASQDRRPVGEHFDDVKLATVIDIRLIAEKEMPSRWISIEVVKGVAYLTGYLPSQNHIDRAIAITRSIKGVSGVHSELQIGEPAVVDFFTDSFITAKVKAKLLDDPIVSGLTMHISTVGGRVYLQGVVSNEIQRVRARQLVIGINGVTAVVDLLSMATTNP
ncbi:MAG: BON domain-containing protein [Mariprofundales bacterium]|nr:BON domain-containing protein [Mariprofundales bacterium]